jgi:hypothetical protein
MISYDCEWAFRYQFFAAEAPCLSGSMLNEALWIDATFDPSLISLDYSFKVAAADN